MAGRPVDISIRLQQITAGLEHEVDQSFIICEMQELVASEAAAIFGFRGHIQQILTLLRDPACGLYDILEEIHIVEEFIQADEYGFGEHKNNWPAF